MSKNFDVIIVGAGPTGMWLACELALQGVRTCILERRTEPTIHSRAMTLHPRTLEVLDMRGLVSRFLERTPLIPSGHFANLPVRLDFSALDTRHPYTAFIAQARTEAVLEQRVNELGVPLLRGHEVSAIEQTSDAAAVTVSAPPLGEHRITASYVVGCDGGNSVVRKAVGIDFPGTDATVTGILGDVQLARPPERPLSLSNAAGTVLLAPLGNGIWRFACQSASRMTLSKETPLGLDELRATVVEILGDDLGLHDPQWLSRYGDANRVASRYRSGRAFLAGDAAHIHFPAGGVGLNVGVQDAMNLGWKLALAVRGFAGDDLLESYHSERHPVGVALCQQSRTQVQLFNWTPNALAMRDSFAQLMQIPAVNRLLAEQVTALAVDYSTGQSGGGVRLGQRIPDFALSSGGRLYEQLHRGQFVLVDPAGVSSTISGWEDRVHTVTGAVLDAPAAWAESVAMLCRPDGHLAWRGERDTDADTLRAVLQSWCGPVSTAAVK
jgi:2-polyprenyl-6-methoxyphenol hydroxylase-like FAD-dependent oxidoreductase